MGSGEVGNWDERAARRVAARWLAEYVGDMVMPGAATLVNEGQRTVWRLPAMVGSPFDEPRGPIGHVDVDAETGVVLSSPTLAGEMIENIERLVQIEQAACSNQVSCLFFLNKQLMNSDEP